MSPIDIHGCSAGCTVCFRYILFRVLAIGVYPVFCRFQESSVIMGADKLQCLLVFGIFVAGMVEKGLDGLAVFIFLAICAGDMASGQAAFLHFALCPAQIPGAVQIAKLAALAGLLIFTAGLAVCTATADFLSTIHMEEFPSEQ